MMTEWDLQDHNWNDSAKAVWILENNWNEKDIRCIYESSHGRLFKRLASFNTIPPWWDTTKRIEIQQDSDK